MDRGGRDALRACPSAVSAGRTGPQDRRPLWLTPSAMSAGRTEAQDRRPLWLAPGRDPRPNGAPTPPPGNTSARPKPRPRERRGREIRYRADSVWLSLDSTHNLYAVPRFPRFCCPPISGFVAGTIVCAAESVATSRTKQAATITLLRTVLSCGEKSGRPVPKAEEGSCPMIPICVDCSAIIYPLPSTIATSSSVRP